MNEAPRRTVLCADALPWLDAQPTLDGCSVFTSLPDASELGPMPLDLWRRWFVDAAAKVLSRVPDDGVAVFYQTDVKRDGAWIDKAHLVHRAADDTGHPLRWHKVVCRVPPGAVAHGRPAYAHLLCFSRGVAHDLARATADVIPTLGAMSWSRAMGLDAARVAVRFIRTHTASHTVVDPFCGVGTALAVANEAGLHAIGVELSSRRARRARSLTVAQLTDETRDARRRETSPRAPPPAPEG